MPAAGQQPNHGPEDGGLDAREGHGVAGQDNLSHMVEVENKVCVGQEHHVNGATAQRIHHQVALRTNEIGCPG